MRILPSPAPTPPPTTPETATTRGKRCHVVVHNLHWSVSHEDINRKIKEITGSDPLISEELECRRKSMKAFRITCAFEHLKFLKGEYFGAHIKVSRYFLQRDRPLGKLSNSTNRPPSRGASQSSPHSTPTPPDESRVSSPPPTEQDINTLISSHRS